jgi:hypothetical protein
MKVCLLARGQRAFLSKPKPAVPNSMLKTNKARKWFTFGDLICAAYTACGKRKSIGFVRLAVNARLIEFRGGQRFEISDQ